MYKQHKTLNHINQYKTDKLFTINNPFSLFYIYKSIMKSSNYKAEASHPYVRELGSVYVSVSVKIDTVVKDRQASIDPFRVHVRVRIRDESRSEQFFTDTDGFMH